MTRSKNDTSASVPISLTSAGSRDSTTPFAASKIMMVDDEPTTIEILEMFLQSEGYEQFVKTTDSREAFALAKQEKPDVLLLDLMMPHVGGLEVLSQIRNDKELQHLPILILTSSTDAETKMRALEIGATDLLAKPVDPSELALRLQNTLSAKAYQDRLAYYDRLTGLPNRLLFMNRLERTLQRAESRSIQCALLHINLDRFKQINDTLGHHVGDELLRAVAERLEQCIRPSDFLGVPGNPDRDQPLSRVGGDEFSVMLLGVSAFEAAARVARRILTSLSEHFRVEEHDLFVTSSIGIALYPTDGRDIQTLLSNANVAMSHAKVSGRNSFQFYDPSFNSEAAQRLTLENELRGAIDRKELLLQYQPKIDIESNRIIGAEALIRWDHPELGRIQPDQFISIAEEAGLIPDIGAWVLGTACRTCQRWREAGYPAKSVAVNVSVKQFQDPKFVETVSNTLDESQLDPALLTLELTETVLAANPRQTAAMLQAIKDMGVRISVDDFGTGYSSLSLLQRFPIDELKIDRSFVQNIPDNEGDAAIVNSVVLLGHSLDLTIVAEGVETQEQLDFIRESGCDSYQGFLRSRPIDPEDFERLLREQG